MVRNSFTKCFLVLLRKAHVTLGVSILKPHQIAILFLSLWKLRKVCVIIKVLITGPFFPYLMMTVPAMSHGRWKMLTLSVKALSLLCTHEISHEPL